MHFAIGLVVRIKDGQLPAGLDESMLEPGETPDTFGAGQTGPITRWDGTSGWTGGTFEVRDWWWRAEQLEVVSS